MKKTLIITLDFPPNIGGVATYVYEFAKHMPEDSVIVLAPKLKGSPEVDNDCKYKIIRKVLLYPLFWPRWLKLFFLARRIIKKEKIELVMVHHALPAGYVALMLKKLFKIPYFVFFHGTDLAKATVSKWKRGLTEKIASGADKIIFNSEFQKRKFLGIFDGFADKVVVSYPCPDESFLQPANATEINALRSNLGLEGRKVLLSVGRFAEGKGFPHLIRLLPAIAERVSDLTLVLIGDGPKKAQMMTMIQKNNLQSIVRFVGQVPNRELPKYFALSDAFALLTHADEGVEEGFGLVFLEAAACGVPVLAGRSGGVFEAVLHAQTGLLVDVQNHDQVVEAIATLLNNKEYAAGLGSFGRQRVRSEFNIAHQIEKVTV